MRLLIILFLAVGLVSLPAHASVCRDVRGAEAPQAHWKVAHYIYDSSLHRDWEVLVDCQHPDAPARIGLAPTSVHRAAGTGAHNVQGTGHEAASRGRANRPSAAPISIKAGAAVEVSNAPDASASIMLTGTALQTALSGQIIRVRLRPSGRFVTGIVRGPHSVELATIARLSWGKP